MTISLADYYNRDDETKLYDEHLFRVGRVGQAAELNEVQSSLKRRVRRIADGLYKDGDILRGCLLRTTLNESTNTYTLSLDGGLIYLAGAVHKIPVGELSVSAVGDFQVGVYLLSQIITEVEDPALRDPAVGLRTYGEPGAARLKITPSWGLDGVGTGDFFPIYQISNGVVFSRSEPPEVNAVNTAISRYDRQSTGGIYAVSGLRVTMLDDDVNGRQNYLVSAGQARINGIEVNLQHDRGVVFDTDPDTREVLAEVYTSTGASGQRIDLRHTPVAGVSQVRVTREVTVSVTHGNFSGAVDPLPNTSITQVLSVVQGATTYVVTTDYLVVGDTIDWTPGGAEPAPGSTYSVTYRYISLESVTPDDTGFVISGTTVSGSQIEVTYTWNLPRIDKIAMNINGEIVRIKGASSVSPRYPDIPLGHLQLASIYQTWTTARQLSNDGFRVVPMWAIEQHSKQIDTLFALVATIELRNDASIREPVGRRGIFVDPFVDNDLRDAGVSQNAAIIGGELTLGVESTVHAQRIGDDIITLDRPAGDAGFRIISQQLLSSDDRKINPYMVFDPLPAIAELNPWQDFWTETTQNTLPIQDIIFLTQNVGSVSVTTQMQATDQLVRHFANQASIQLVSDEVTTEVSSSIVESQFLRANTVRFRLDYFGGGEVVTDVQIDGKSLTFEAQP